MITHDKQPNKYDQFAYKNQYYFAKKSIKKIDRLKKTTKTLVIQL